MSVLKAVNSGESDQAIEQLANEIATASDEEDAVAHNFFSARLRVPILLAFLIAFFNQMSGINAILYFAPRIFGLTGLEEKAALLQSIGIGVTNLVFTFVGLWLIDRLGRRSLLFIGSYGYILSLGLVAATFLSYAPQFKVASDAIALKDASSQLLGASGKDFSAEKMDLLEKDYEDALHSLGDSSADDAYDGEAVVFPSDATPEETITLANTVIAQASEQSGPGGTIVLFSIFAFIAAHAIGQGAVIWVFISEIFPNRHRAEGQALGSFTHWIFAALLTFFFPMMVAKFPPGFVFLFFAGMMVLQLIWVATMVPETKGVPLEKIQEKLGIV